MRRTDINMKKVFGHIIIFLLLLTSCKKYDDGPNFSLRTPEKRLCRKWKLSETTQRGETVTFSLNPKYDVEYQKNGTIILRLVSPGNVWTTPPPDYAEGNWKFFDDKKKIYSTIFMGNDTLNVLRLTSKELWLHDVTNDYGLNDVVYKYKADN